MLGIVATNGLWSKWADGLDPLCPSCQRCTETSKNVLLCEEAGHVLMLLATIDLVQQWMWDAGNNLELLHCVIQYAAAQSSETMVDICCG